MASILERVQEVVADKLSVDTEEVTPEASFTEDLNADSLDLVELIMAFEEEGVRQRRQSPRNLRRGRRVHHHRPSRHRLPQGTGRKRLAPLPRTQNATFFTRAGRLWSARSLRRRRGLPRHLHEAVLTFLSLPLASYRPLIHPPRDGRGIPPHIDDRVYNECL